MRRFAIGTARPSSLPQCDPSVDAKQRKRHAARVEQYPEYLAPRRQLLWPPAAGGHPSLPPDTTSTSCFGRLNVLMWGEVISALDDDSSPLLPSEATPCGGRRPVATAAGQDSSSTTIIGRGHHHDASICDDVPYEEQHETAAAADPFASDEAHHQLPTQFDEVVQRLEATWGAEVQSLKEALAHERQVTEALRQDRDGLRVQRDDLLHRVATLRTELTDTQHSVVEPLQAQRASLGEQLRCEKEVNRALLQSLREATRHAMDLAEKLKCVQEALQRKVGEIDRDSAS